MSTSQRITGHSLWNEGAPHDDRGARIGWSGVAGFGRALCVCGELSPELPTAAARKRWHREHKAAAASPEPKETRP